MRKEANNGDVESICARLTKHASKKAAKVEVNLKWIWRTDYGLFWFHIYIHEWFILFDTSAFAGFMIYLFLAVPTPRVSSEWHLMGTSVRSGLRFFPLFGKNKAKFYTKLSFLINDLSEKWFSNFRSNRLSMQCETPMVKKYFNSWKKYSLVCHFLENQVFINSALYSCFSVFSLFKLMQLVVKCT